MKRFFAILTALTLLLALTACGAKTAGDADASGSDGSGAPEASAETTETTELVIFAAASMQETLSEIVGNYMADHPEIKLTYNFDSSGTLKTQIQEGAECDIFISAGQKQMDQLDAAASPDVNTEGLDFVDAATRFDLLENKVALAVPEGNPAGIETFDQLAELLKNGGVFLAIGNEDVPVGQYTQKIFDFYGLTEEELKDKGVLTYGSNVKEVTTQVSEGTVDCGVIYATDAFSAGLTIADTATAEMCGQVIYPAAVLNVSQHPDEAKAFLDYVRSDAGAAVLESVGFTPLG